MATLFCQRYPGSNLLHGSDDIKLFPSDCRSIMLDVWIQLVDLHLDCFVCVFGLLPSAFSLHVPVFVSQNDRQHLKKNIAWKLPTRNIHRSQTFIACGFRTARTWCGARRIGTRTRLLRPSGGSVFCGWFDPLKNTLLASVLKNFVAKFVPWEYAFLGVFVEVKSKLAYKKAYV